MAKHALVFHVEHGHRCTIGALVGEGFQARDAEGKGVRRECRPGKFESDVVFNSESDGDGAGLEFVVACREAEKLRGGLRESGPGDFESRLGVAGFDRFGVTRELHSRAELEFSVEFGAIAVEGESGGDLVRVVGENRQTAAENSRTHDLEDRMTNHE